MMILSEPVSQWDYNKIFEIPWARKDTESFTLPSTPSFLNTHLAFFTPVHRNKKRSPSILLVFLHSASLILLLSLYRYHIFLLGFFFFYLPFRTFFLQKGYPTTTYLTHLPWLFASIYCSPILQLFLYLLRFLFSPYPITNLAQSLSRLLAVITISFPLPPPHTCVYANTVHFMLFCFCCHR